MTIEYIKDIIERLETAEVIGDIDWDTIDDELVAMGLCHEEDSDCDDAEEDS
tara:strand:- start:273 stop:428 length:156 start_codon:yes stop_codon:yes gene_type:complete